MKKNNYSCQLETFRRLFVFFLRASWLGGVNIYVCVCAARKKILLQFFFFFLCYYYERPFFNYDRLKEEVRERDTCLFLTFK